jgi:hypothetical protein
LNALIGAVSVGLQSGALKGNTVNRLKLTREIVLIIGYVVLVAATYAIGRVFPDSLALLALAYLTAPFSALVGLVSIGLSHSSYVFPLDVAFLPCAAMNCLCFYFIRKRSLSKRNVERSAENGD